MGTLPYNTIYGQGNIDPIVKRMIKAFPVKPPNPYVGNMYKDSDSRDFYIYDGQQWVNFEMTSLGPDYDGTINDDGTIPGLASVVCQAIPGVKQGGLLSRNGINSIPTTEDMENIMLNPLPKISELGNETKESDLKYVYCPFNGDMTVYDVLNNRVDELCGTLTRDKYEKIISRCTKETEFDGVKNLKCKVCELGAVVDKLEELTKK